MKLSYFVFLSESVINELTPYRQMKKFISLFVFLIMAVLQVSADVTVTVTDNTTTGADGRGTFTNGKKTWTSNASSGLAGLVVASSTASFDNGTWSGARSITFKPSAVGATDVITITAPAGYTIKSFELGGYQYTGTESYTLTANGQTVQINSTTFSGSIPSLSVTGINAQSTSITFKHNGTTNNRYMIVPWFNITLSDPAFASEILPTKLYAVKNQRSMWTYDDANDVLTGVGALGRAEIVSDTRNQFAFINLGGSTYLYNVEANQFLNSNGKTVTDLSQLSPITWTKDETTFSGTPYQFFFNFDASHNINMVNAKSIQIDGWTTHDAGNLNALVEVGDFDAAATLYSMGIIEVTYNIVTKADGPVLASPIGLKSTTGDMTLAVPSEYARDFCSYTYYSDAALTIPVTEAVYPSLTNVYAKLTWNGPFAYFDDYASIDTWYKMRIHSNQTHHIYSNSGTLSFADVNAETSDYLWGFVGNPIEGFQVYNRGAGSGVALDNTNPCALSAGGTSAQFKVKTGDAGTQGLYADGYFCLYATAGSYLNYQNGAIKRWGSADAGSTFMIDAPLTDADVTALKAVIGKVGYPKTTSASAENFYAIADTYLNASASDKQSYQRVLTEAVAALYRETDVVMPTHGKVYTLRNHVITGDASHYIYDSDFAGTTGTFAVSTTPTTDDSGYWQAKHVSGESVFSFANSNAHGLGFHEMGFSKGSLITSESSLVSGKAYIVEFQGTGKPYVEDKGDYYAAPNTQQASLTMDMVYYLTGDATHGWQLQNASTGKCWGKLVAKDGTPSTSGFVPSSPENAGTYTLNMGSNGVALLTCNGFYIDRSNQKLHAWQGGTNNGFKFYEIAYPEFTLSKGVEFGALTMNGLCNSINPSAERNMAMKNDGTYTGYYSDGKWNSNNGSKDWSTDWYIEEVEPVYFATALDGETTLAGTFTYTPTSKTASLSSFMVIPSGTPTAANFTTTASFSGVPSKGILTDEETGYKRVYFVCGTAVDSDNLTKARGYVALTGLGYPKITSSAYLNLKAAVDALEGGSAGIYTNELFKALIEAWETESDIVLPEKGKAYVIKGKTENFTGRYLWDSNTGFLVDKMKGGANGLTTSLETNPHAHSNNSIWLCVDINDDGRATFKSALGNMLGDLGCGSSSNIQPYYMVNGLKHPYFGMRYGKDSGNYLAETASATSGSNANGLHRNGNMQDDASVTTEWELEEVAGTVYTIIVNKVNAPTTYEDIAPYLSVTFNGWADPDRTAPYDYSVNFTETTSPLGFYVIDEGICIDHENTGAAGDKGWSLRYTTDYAKIYEDFRDSTFVVDNTAHTITINTQFDYPVAIPALWEMACAMRDTTGFGWPKADAASRTTMRQTLQDFEDAHYNESTSTWDAYALSAEGYNDLFYAMQNYYTNTGDGDIELPVNGASVLLVSQFHPNNLVSYQNYVYNNNGTLAYGAAADQIATLGYGNQRPDAPTPAYLWTLQRDNETVNEVTFNIESSTTYTGSDRETKSINSRTELNETDYTTAIASLTEATTPTSTETDDEGNTTYTYITSGGKSTVQTSYSDVSYTSSHDEPSNSTLSLDGQRNVILEFDSITYEKVEVRNSSDVVTSTTYNKVSTRYRIIDQVQTVHTQYPSYFLANNGGGGYIGRTSATVENAIMTNDSTLQFNVALMRGTQLGTISMLFIKRTDNKVRYISGNLAGDKFDWYSYKIGYATNDAVVTGIWTSNWNFVQARNVDTHKEGSALTVRGKALQDPPNIWENPIFEGFPITFAANAADPTGTTYETGHRYATLNMPFSVYLPADRLNAVYTASGFTAGFASRKGITLTDIKPYLTVPYDYNEDGTPEDIVILPRETPVIIDINNNVGETATGMDYYYLCPSLSLKSKQTNEQKTGLAAAQASNKLSGSLVAENIPTETVYVLSRRSAGAVSGTYAGESLNTVAFFRFTGSTLGANKAYIKLSDIEVSSVKEMNGGLCLIDSDQDEVDLETLVEGLNQGELVPMGDVYDLTGRKLNAIPQKGVYIMNGKKYIAK